MQMATVHAPQNRFVVIEAASLHPLLDRIDIHIDVPRVHERPTKTELTK